MIHCFSQYWSQHWHISHERCAECVCVLYICTDCVYVSQQEKKKKSMLCSCGTPLCDTLSVHLQHHTHVHENLNVWTHKHTHNTSPRKLLMASCEEFDIRLPADDAAANANAAQGLKQQWKTTNKIQRQMKLHTAELSSQLGRITEENTHSSVSPGILSLSRWAFMAELCSFALLWTWYAFTLPACRPPPALTKSQT